MSTKRLFLVLLAAGLLAGPAAAQEAEPPAHEPVPPPAPGEPRDYALPEKTVFSLDNGIQVTMVPFGRVPKASILVRVRAGNLNEGEQTWLADFTGQLMQEGTETMDATALNRAAAMLGGSIGIGVGPETTTASFSALADKAPEAVALLAEVLRRPALPASELERIRRDFLRNLSIARSQPQGQASMAFYRQLYGDHPFAVVFPTEAQLAGYTIEDVRRFYRENFGARRTDIFISGRFDAEAMVAAIREHFGDWAPGPEPYIDIPHPTRKGSLTVVDRPGAPQSTVYVGIPVMDVTDPNYTELQFMNTMLGGGAFLARLMQNIREDKGYAYSPSSTMNAHYRDNIWIFTADVTTAATGPAMTELFREIRRIQTEPPPADEMARIRGYRGGIFVLANASPGGIIGTLAFMDFHGLPDSYLTEYLERLEAVTPADVNRVATEQLPVAGMTVVILGDRAAIDGQLAEVAPLEPYLGGTP